MKTYDAFHVFPSDHWLGECRGLRHSLAGILRRRQMKQSRWGQETVVPLHEGLGRTASLQGRTPTGLTTLGLGSSRPHLEVVSGAVFAARDIVGQESFGVFVCAAVIAALQGSRVTLAGKRKGRDLFLDLTRVLMSDSSAAGEELLDGCALFYVCFLFT